MSTDRSHIPALPAFIFYLRYAQILLTVTVLALSAIVANKHAYSGISLSLFTASLTVILITYNIVTTTIHLLFYSYWLVLAFDTAGLILWTVTAAILAYEASTWPRITTENLAYRFLTAVSAGLGGLEIFLFVITLVFSLHAFLKHRSNGGRTTPMPERDHVSCELRDQETLAPPPRLHDRPIRLEAFRPMLSS